MNSDLLAAVALAFTAVLLSSCASSSSGTNPDGTPKDEASVHTLPWSKPASWEGQGAIPGMGGGH